jgi:hypothetical protein
LQRRFRDDSAAAMLRWGRRNEQVVPNHDGTPGTPGTTEEN